MKPKILFLFIMIILLNSTGGLNYDKNSITVKQMDQTINIDNKSWDTTIYIITPDNWFNSDIELIFPAELNIESTKINDTPSPTQVFFRDGSTKIIISPIVNINGSKVVKIDIIATLVFDLVITNNNNQMFRYFIGLNYPVQTINLSITLPKYAAISSDNGHLNVSPTNFKTTTDGESISINWLDLFIDNELKSIIVEFDHNIVSNEDTVTGNIYPKIHSLFGIIIGVVMSVFSFLIMNKYNKRLFNRMFKVVQADSDESKTRITTVVKPILLKNYQRKILEILREFEDGILQNELVQLLNLSKSRVSQYLKELENLAIISRNKVGRENRIYLNVEIDLE